MSGVESFPVNQLYSLLIFQEFSETGGVRKLLG